MIHMAHLLTAIEWLEARERHSFDYQPWLVTF